MSVNNRLSSNIEAEQSELEATIEMKIDEIKADNVKTINTSDIKISAIALKKPSSNYEHPSSDITKFPLLKLPYNSSHAPQFNKHMSYMNL